VARQHLLASFAELGTVLLQAGKDDLVAILHLRPAKPGDVARAGILPHTLLRGSRRRD